MGNASITPAERNFNGNLALSLGFVVIFLSVYSAADYFGGLAGYRIPVAFAFERRIPFAPATSVIYLSIIPLLFLSNLIFPTPVRLLPLLATLSIEVLAAGVIFVFLPIEKTFPPRVVEGLWGYPFAIADFVNLNHNDLPALHVALSLSAAIAYARVSGASARLLYYGWAVAIAASALLMHEHHIADIVAGGALAVLAMVTVYPYCGRESTLKPILVEWACLREFMAFARRHRRYLVIMLYLYGYGLFRWRRTRVTRVGFCFLQAVDDLLDGDRPSEREPAEIVAELISEIEQGEYGKSRLSLLAEFLAGELLGMNDADDEPRSCVIDLMRHMIRDRERVRDGLLFDRAELYAHHGKTFRLSLNVLMIGIGATTRAGDAPDLIEALGWCSTMRDLKDDLQHGLVNIPVEVLREAQKEGGDPKDLNSLVGTPSIKTWFDSELMRARKHLTQSSAAIARLEDRKGARVLGIFQRSIEKFAAGFERRMVRRRQNSIP